MNKKQRIVRGQGAFNITVAPMFSSLMSAGFHDQSPLLTMLYARRMHAKAEKYIDTIFSLNSDQESINLRLTYLDITKAD